MSEDRGGLAAELVMEEAADARTVLALRRVCRRLRSVPQRTCWRSVLLSHKAFRAWRRSKRVVRPLVASWARRRVRNDDTPVMPILL